MGTKLFDLVTLTLKFDLLIFKTLTLTITFEQKREGVHMCISYDKTLHTEPLYLT